MTKEYGSFDVVDLVEHEDGSATVTLEADGEHLGFIYQIGLAFVLFCSAASLTRDEAFAAIVEIAKGKLEEANDL